MSPANATFACDELFGIFNPTNKLVTSEGSDVVPLHERIGIGQQSGTQISGQLVHHSTSYTLSAHARQRSEPLEVIALFAA